MPVMNSWGQTSRVLGILSVGLLLACWPAGGSASSRPTKPPGCDRDLIRFFVVGHVYGQPSRWPNPPVAETLLKNVERIRDEKPDFVIFLGDIVKEASPEAFDNLELALLKPLSVPTFNAPGNHDLSIPKNYEASWGATHFSFICGSSGFLVLNSEASGQSLEQQLEFVRAFIESVGARGEIRNLFVFSHKLVWAVEDGKYDLVGRRSHWQDQSSLFLSVMPMLRTLMGRKNISWGSGDIGLDEGFGTFLDHDDSSGITWYAVGLGDNISDAIVEVVVERAEPPRFYKRSLVPALGGRRKPDGFIHYFFRSAIRKFKSFF